MANDTDPASERVWIDRWRKQTPAFRLRRAIALSDEVIARSKAAIAASHPTLPPREHDLRWVEVHYGREIASHLRAHLNAAASQS